MLDEESWREFLQGFRHYQDLLRQFSREADAQVLHASEDVSQPSAGDQPLAGADDSAEAPRDHEPARGDDGGSFDVNAEYEEDSGDDGFHPFIYWI
ncbi:unnamed protein product [Urochloa humidicola]